VYRKAAASDRYIHYTSEQAWREKACAIRTLRNRAHLYCSNEEFLADELAYLLETFIQNGYPEDIVYRLLYKENRFKDALEERWGKTFDVDFSKCFYVPYHPRARKLYRLLEKKFGHFVAYKKTSTLGDLLLRKGRQIQPLFEKKCGLQNSLSPVQCSIHWANQELNQCEK